jgi:uncharacterized protein YdaU (DUF1376 family)
MTKAVPYFPLYAANFIASKPFRLMTIEERGLWITMQLECWVNGSVPADQKELAKYLGCSIEEIQRSFSQKQYSFLEKIGDELKSPELEEQRKEFMERREQQRLGGIKGAKQRKENQAVEKLTKEQGQPPALPEGQPKGSLSYINSASIKSSSVNSNQFTNMKLTDKEFESWMDDAKDAPDITNDYLRASKGI